MFFMVTGIFIGRFQPFHIGHLSVIYQMSQEVDEIIIGIGSAQYFDTEYNPFTADERELMIRKSLNIDKPYQIFKLNDLNDFPRWVPYVEYVCPKFDVVYSGNTIVKQLFEEREYKTVQPNNIKKISATEIRKMMLENKTWKEYLPEGAISIIEAIDGIARLKNLHKR